MARPGATTFVCLPRQTPQGAASFARPPRRQMPLAPWGYGATAPRDLPSGPAAREACMHASAGGSRALRRLRQCGAAQGALRVWPHLLPLTWLPASAYWARRVMAPSAAARKMQSVLTRRRLGPLTPWPALSRRANFDSLHTSGPVIISVSRPGPPCVATTPFSSSLPPSSSLPLPLARAAPSRGERACPRARPRTPAPHAPCTAAANPEGDDEIPNTPQTCS